MRHISIQRYDSTYSSNGNEDREYDHDHPPPPPGSAAGGAAHRCWSSLRRQQGKLVATRSRSPRLCSAAVVFLLLTGFFFAYQALHRLRTGRFRHRRSAVPIERAREHLVEIGAGLQIWCRTWGNAEGGVPVLFVHGGPGNAISDYGTSNSAFFDYEKFFVVEVDQRGTGKSKPSVRESCRNMRHYTDISIGKMSRDYESVREYLGIDRWLVFGGSWGSTLSLDYSMRYPDRVLGLIIRGIYLNTRPEFDAVYTRRAFDGNPKRQAEFDDWFARAQNRARKDGDGSLLDPNDPKRFFEVYRRMLLDCDRSAIWHWYVFENNLMETVPEDLRDPYRIRRSDYAEAQSVAFFENTLFYHGTFEDPPDLLGRLDRLKSIRVWVCQGNYDEVCPPRYAHQLADGLKEAGVDARSYFVDSGHEASDPVMAECLVSRVQDFLESLPPP
jgi:proline iminopeptidase